MKATLLMLASAAAVIWLSGCATGYHAQNSNGGFTDAQLATNVFKISFRGNQYTLAQQTKDLTMLHASEVVLQHGFDHFSIVQEQDLSKVQKSLVNGTDYKPAWEIVVRGYSGQPAGMFSCDAVYLRDTLRRQYEH